MLTARNVSGANFDDLTVRYPGRCRRCGCALVPVDEVTYRPDDTHGHIIEGGLVTYQCIGPRRLATS